MTIKSKWAAAVFIVMALVLALGMALVAAPVKNGGEAEAATQRWSGMLPPNPMTAGFIPASEVLLIALSPNFDTDNTIYAVTWDFGLVPPGGTLLRKSADGGYWWETMGGGLTGAAIVAMAVAPDDPNYIVVVEATNIVYASSDGGATFSAVGVVPLSDVIDGVDNDGDGQTDEDAITSVDVSPLISGVHQIMVGVIDTGAGFLTGEGVYIWGVGTPPAMVWRPEGLDNAIVDAIVDPARDVTSVAFSTEYTADSIILAVGSQAATGAGDTFLHLRDTTDAQGDWDDSITVTFGYPVLVAGVGVVIDDGVNFSPSEATIVSSSIALPEDWDGTIGTKRITFVRYVDDGTLPLVETGDDAWRINNFFPWRLNVFGGAAVGTSSMAYAGTISSGALLVGMLAGVVGPPPRADVYVTTAPCAGVVMWTSAVKAPTGTGFTMVAATADFVTSGVAYAGTSGGVIPPDESGLSKTEDFGVSWNQVGLIDTIMDGGITDVAAIDATTVLITSVNTMNGTASLWKSVPGPIDFAYWERIDCVAMANVPDVELSPNFATDNTMYWADAALGVGGTTLIRVSQDGGATFRTRNTPAIAPISDFVVQDANTIYVVDATNPTVYKSSDAGKTWPVTGILALSANVIELSPDGGTLAVTCAMGVVAICSDTTTHPLPFTEIGLVPGAAGIQYLCFSNEYDADGLMYVANAGGGVFKVEPLLMTQIDLTALLANIVTAPSGIRCADDGTLYVADAGVVTTTTTMTVTGTPEPLNVVVTNAAGFAVAVVVTVSYLNQVGVAGVGTATIPAGALLGQTFGVTLAAGDTGALDVATATCAPLDVAGWCNIVGATSGAVLGTLDCTVATGPTYTDGATLGTATTTTTTVVTAPSIGVARTMNPREDPIPGVEPQWVSLSWGLTAGATLGGVGAIPLAAPANGLEVVSGSNALFSIDTTTALIAGAIVTTPVSFTDTLVAVGVTLVSPTNGAITGVVEAIPVGTPRVRVDFEWSPVPDAHVYELQIDTDAGFHNPTIALITAPDTTVTNAGVLLTDMEYYWRVRVNQFLTVAGTSPWSAAWSFTTPVGTAAIAPEILGPEHGATDVRVEDPCFTWGSVTGATEYKFTLKDSAGAVLVDTTATETSYCYAGELEYETSYVWTVQGTSATTESGVAAATFSTEAEAEPTPAWVWIIIAIGAVVAIVVIVLIVRTRRPV